jgi:hypothetical protein
MRRGGGKAKGSQFERDMCVVLSKWISDGKSEDLFWRSALSGGRATIGQRKGKFHSSQVGDISAIHPDGHYFISSFAPECKFYASLDYSSILSGKGKLLTFWAEIRKQAHTHDKMPFLMAKQNRMPVFVHLCKSGMAALGLDDRVTAQTNMPHDLYTIEADWFFGNCAPYVALDRRHSFHRQRARLK